MSYFLQADISGVNSYVIFQYRDMKVYALPVLFHKQGQGILLISFLPDSDPTVWLLKNHTSHYVL